ncbi:MAG: thioredoxin family protein [Akkermansiaceae bacterium]|nr:thioredoxin family protein [Akkermansiaceae bacterium]
MMNSPSFINVLSAFALLSLPLQAEYRNWSNTEGVTLEAELVKVEGSNVTLRLQSGKLTTFAVSKLSPADREFAKSNTAKPQEEPKSSLPANRKAKWLTRMEKAQEEAKTTGLPILVLFTGTSWCSYCIKLEKEVFSEKAFKTFADQNLVLLIADFEPGGETKNRELKKLSEEYGVKGFPSYFLIDAAGTRLAKGGYHDGINPESFAEWVKKSAPKTRDAQASATE